MSDLARYGLEWSGPKDFVCVQMEDGYWTPWHIAEGYIATLEAQLAAAEADAGRPILKKLTGAGQITQGAPLLLEMRDGRLLAETAKVVLFTGDAGEEVVYRKTKNWYFITGMVVNNESHVRNVWMAAIDAARGVE